MEDDNGRSLFRYPPPRITEACAAYMDRVFEIREFLSSFFNMIKSFEALTVATQKANPAALAEYKVGLIPALYNYSTHMQFINEITVSRIVETFDLYVLMTIRSIFRARPEMLKAEDPISVAQVIELKNFEDIITHVAERQLHKLSYKPLSDLEKFIKSRTGIDLFKDAETYNRVLLTSEVRNLIAHNDCQVNDIFRSRVGDRLGTELSIEDGKLIIPDRWMRVSSYTLDGVVFDFDQQVSEKFGIETRSGNKFRGTRKGVAHFPPAIQVLTDEELLEMRQQDDAS